MTPEQIKLAQCLVKAKFQPGSWDKKFARDLAAMSYKQPTPELTTNQHRCLLQNVIRYRRSLDPAYVKLAKELLVQETPDAPHGIIQSGKEAGSSKPICGFQHSNFISQLGLPG
jgi:hypothetical protein